MLTLARTNAIKDREELKRLIKREKVILRMNARRLVLVCDFFAAVNVYSDSESHPTFSRVFGKNAEVVMTSFSRLKEKHRIRCVNIGYKDMRGEAKKEILQTVTDHIDEKISEAKRTGMPASMFGEYYNPDFPPITEADFTGRARQRRIQEFTKIFNKPAHKLENFIRAMDTHSLWISEIGGRVSRYESLSFNDSEMQEVLSFWKKINALDSYGDGPASSDDTPMSGGKRQKVGIMASVSKALGGFRPGVAQPT